jgi:hypothetical protein
MHYDEKYEIRLACIEDIDSIMIFINEYWKKGHLLGTNREMFMYEHSDETKVNFLLAIDRNNQSISGILGFIPASHNPEKYDIWTGIWKVKAGSMPLLGVEMYKRLPAMLNARSLLGVGDNQETTGLLLKKILKSYNTWRMKHFYLLQNRDGYKIAVIRHKSNSQTVKENYKTEVVPLNTIRDVEIYREALDKQTIPYKDLWYIEHRYFRHPVYRYYVYGLKYQDGIAVLVLRVQKYKDSGAIRIVDYIGDQFCFSGLNEFFQSILKIFHCEYADFYVQGFENQYIFEAGFSERIEGDETVIPNYFSPFEQRNIEIYVSGNIEKGLFCKADGDQDRPN